MKKPTRRTIGLTLRLSELNLALSGSVYVNDYGDGATKHAIDGRLTDQKGVVYALSANLSGVKVLPIERRGRPRNLGRDIALWMAFRWFQCLPRSESVARKNVIDLWESNCWAGVSEDTHLNKKLRAAKKHMKKNKLSVLCHVCTDSLDGIVVAMDESAFDVAPFQHMHGDGRGWFWRYGEKEASFGVIRFNASLCA